MFLAWWLSLFFGGGPLILWYKKFFFFSSAIYWLYYYFFFYYQVILFFLYITIIIISALRWCLWYADRCKTFGLTKVCSLLWMRSKNVYGNECLLFYELFVVCISFFFFLFWCGALLWCFLRRVVVYFTFYLFPPMLVLYNRLF